MMHVMMQAFQDPTEKVTPESKISKSCTSTSLDSSSSTGDQAVRNLDSQLAAAAAEKPEDGCTC